MSSEASPLVSVVIETVTTRYDMAAGDSFVDDLNGTIGSLERQTYPTERIEAIVVVDPDVPPEAIDEIPRRFPFVTVATADTTNYAIAKNVGAEAASGSLITFLDGDCVPESDWLERLVARFEPGVDVVGGRTRYQDTSWWSRALSVQGFGHVLNDSSGNATSFVINNVAFRSDVLRAFPIDRRIRRNGGCTLLFHRLRAAGKNIVYEPRARISHSDGDIRGVHFIKKHFGRGFDSADLYHLDSDGVLRGTRFVKRFGILALTAIAGRRIARDIAVVLRHSDQIGVSPVTVPVVALIGIGIRLIEFAGMITRALRPGYFSDGSPRPVAAYESNDPARIGDAGQ